MSSETWALVGVVVGAILGGVAQLFGDTIRHRRDTQTRVRDERREAYTDLMAAATTAIVPSAASMSVMDDDNPEPTHAQLMLQKDQLLAA